MLCMLLLNGGNPFLQVGETIDNQCNLDFILSKIDFIEYLIFVDLLFKVSLLDEAHEREYHD